MRNDMTLTGLIAKSLIGVMLVLTAGQTVQASERIILQSTTSTHNSGLYEAILPQYTAVTGDHVRVVSVGTGQAIKNAENCDGDVLLVHSKVAEEKFVADGYGDFRRDLMFNDFVIIGPVDDPAGLREASDLTDAMLKLVEGSSLFISRGDDSGTHKAEHRLWAEAGVDTTLLPITSYQEVGNGMGATINIAVETKAYTLTDRSTWTAFNNKRDAVIVFEGDPSLHNQYGIIPVSKSHCPRVKHKAALKFIDWMLSEDGQTAIADFKRNDTQLFFPNAE
jgi:tungstate transport system substrate-binding protein